jgi:hypothetical protein
VNPRYRIYAAAGVAGLIVLAGAYLVLGHGSSSSSAAVPTIKPLHPVKGSKRAAARRTVRKKTARAVLKTAAKVASPLAPPAVPTTKPTDGIPASLSAALARHSVVVLSLVSPVAQVDEMAYLEAKAGAAQAGAGFVRISTADNANVQALSTLVDSSVQPGDRLLDDPAVLIFRRPQQLFVRINGFIDAATVAQAAANAAPLAAVQPSSVARTSAWALAANGACRQLASEVASLSVPTSVSAVIPWLQKVIAAEQSALLVIHALKPPKGAAGQVAGLFQHYNAGVSADNRALAAARRGNLTQAQSLAQQAESEGAQGNAIAVQLGATSCVPKP